MTTSKTTTDRFRYFTSSNNSNSHIDERQRQTQCLTLLTNFQDERSDGGKTSGSYYVALPDGRLQRVTYTVNGDEGKEKHKKVQISIETQF